MQKIIHFLVHLGGVEAWRNKWIPLGLVTTYNDYTTPPIILFQESEEDLEMFIGRWGQFIAPW